MVDKIRVLIVDDSAIVRKMLARLLSSDPQIEVVGWAPDPYIAREKLFELKPDVMTLDIEMPRMDGITFLNKVMKHRPTRTLVISSLSKRGSEMALRAFEVGAIDVIEKPSIDVQSSLESQAKVIIDKVKVVARANLVGYQQKIKTQPVSAQVSASLGQTTHQILAFASSTGGTEALRVVLSHLPPNIPGTLIVQHMPPVFTNSYANSLNKLCPFEVKEAKDGDKVVPGQVLLAPGNYHMELNRSGAFYFVQLHQKPFLHGVRPAADYLMKSVANKAGKNAVGVILTGMGRDGADGLLAMKNSGSYNIAQDEKSCVVFGMPKEAIEIGAIDKVITLERIAGEIVNQLRLRNAA